MKAAGLILGALSLAGAAAYLWWFYVVIFEEMNPKYSFEVEPKEGYDYWRRVEFWEDLRKFSCYGALSIFAGLLPWIGMRRWSRRRSSCNRLDVALAFIAAIYSGLFIWLGWTGMRSSLHWFHLSSVFLAFGCLYSMIALIARKTVLQPRQ